MSNKKVVMAGVKALEHSLQMRAPGSAKPLIVHELFTNQVQLWIPECASYSASSDIRPRSLPGKLSSFRLRFVMQKAGTKGERFACQNFGASQCSRCVLQPSPSRRPRKRTICQKLKCLAVI